MRSSPGSASGSESIVSRGTSPSPALISPTNQLEFLQRGEHTTSAEARSAVQLERESWRPSPSLQGSPSARDIYS